MQRRLAAYIAESIVSEYNIPISIQRLEVRNLDELLLKEVAIKGNDGDTIINAAEATAHISVLDLLDNKLSINTITFAEPQIRLSRETPEGELNIQFIIDNIANKQSNKEKKGFSLSINQLIVYDGKFTYDIKSLAQKGDRFDSNHIEITDFGCNVSLKSFSSDTLSIYLRSIRGKERSGLELNGFRARVNASPDIIKLRHLEIKLPNGNLLSDSVDIILGSDSLTQPTVTGELRSDCFSMQDFAALHPKLGYDIPQISFNAQYKLSPDAANADISLNSIDDCSKISAEVILSKPRSEERSLTLFVHDALIEETTTEFVSTLFGNNTIAKYLSGDLTFNGEGHISENALSFNLQASNGNGAVFATANLDSTGHYNARLQGNNILLSRLAGIKDLQHCNITATANGNINSPDKIAEFNSEITNLKFNNYNYAPIVIKGNAYRNKVDVYASTEEPNLAAEINFEFNSNTESNNSRLCMNVSTFNPGALNLIKAGTDNIYSFTLNGTFTHRGREDWNAIANIDEFTISNSEQKKTVRNIYIVDNRTKEERILAINSDFLKGSIIGDFNIKTLPGSFASAISKHLPSLNIGNATRKGDTNNLFYTLEIEKTDILQSIFNIPLAINEGIAVSGICDDKENIYTLSLLANNLDIAGGLYRKLEISGQSDNNGFCLTSTIQKPIIRNKKNFNYNDLGNDIVLGMQTDIKNDTIRNSINWNNRTSSYHTAESDIAGARRNQGRLRFDATLNKANTGQVHINAKIHNDVIIHNDSVWYISEGTIEGNLERLYVENISLHNETQYLRIGGVAGIADTDTLKVSTNNLEVATILDLVNFKLLKINGCATGDAHVTSLLSNPDARGRFNVENMGVDGALMGDCDARIGWSNELKAILLNCGIKNSRGLSTVEGFLSQANDTISIRIDADNLNTAFINKKLGAYLDNVRGTASGLVHLRGSWRFVDLYGAVALDCSTRIKATNATYTFMGDTLRFTKGTLKFENARLRDKDGNSGILSGTVNHNYLSQWTCGLHIEFEDFLVYDTPNFGSLPFYGTVYGKGYAQLKSDGKGLSLSANIVNSPNSKFIYNSSDIGGVRDNSFVTFVDNSKIEETSTTTTFGSIYNSVSDVSSKLNLDFLLDLNDSFKLRVYTNMRTDDYIDIYGNGTIHAIYDDKAGFSMKGNLALDRGTYKFTIQDIFPKEFNIERGSTLHFSGDPFSAALNLKTKYLIPSVSLSDLTTSSTTRNTVKVNCLMNITGTLKSPVLNFDLELPEGSEEERELLASIASTPEQKNMQFIYLLGIGKFYTFDYHTPNNSGQTSTAVESLISNTLSNQLNNMLGQIIDNGNWDISGNFSTSERGWNSMEVEGMLEGRLLNNRLLINGNLGYRENPVANRNFIGDFEVQWLLNPKGTFSLKAYSKTNDRYFSKTNLTTQGAGILYRFEFDDWRWWRKKEEVDNIQEEEEEEATTEEQ